MEKLKFIHKVSKGTRFNQIYIPQDMHKHFEAGDLVEVTLLEKKDSLFYSGYLNKLNDFKENLIKKIFLLLEKYKQIEQIFVVGSFLSQKQDFNDIDIILISNENLENEIYRLLIEKFEMKFHIITLQKNSFEDLIKYCPLTRGMLYFFVSNKEFMFPKKTELNKNHIKFLLMMPEDILNITLNPRVFYDSLRRLLTIERFLENQPLNPLDINKKIITLLGENLALNLRQNEPINDNIIKKLRDIIKLKLNNIYSILNKLDN